MSRRKLPIGIQTFREVREDDCYYVDKTAHIRRLADEGKHFFLSRPRRFGKSLFLDTCKELFEGNEALFEGLAIHEHWDWSVRHPVVRLSFGSGHFQGPDDLRTEVTDRLNAMEEAAGVTAHPDSIPARFHHLIEVLHRRMGRRVAVLIDEYDKPILDALDTPDIARANRDFLRGLYAVVKDSDAHIRFSFLTGVSKFSKVSLFSGINNLNDITLDPRYCAICGYTDRDLDTVFAPELPGLDRDAIRERYNGYGWRGEERVYNPFDILLLFDKREFGAWWFETGTPAFLVETLFKRRVSTVALDDMMSTGALLSAFDVDDIATEALLFQTGYLTIREEQTLGGKALYRLGYPNREVRQSLNECLLEYLVRDRSRQTANSIRLVALLQANDFEGLKALFHALLRGHSLRVVHQQRHRALRGLLRERVLLVLRGTGARHHGGGQHEPRAAGHGGALQRQRLPVRAQGGGDGGGGGGDGAVEGEGLRGEVPGEWGADSPGGGGVQPGYPQRGGVRGRARLSRRLARRHPEPGRQRSDGRTVRARRAAAGISLRMRRFIAAGAGPVRRPPSRGALPSRMPTSTAVSTANLTRLDRTPIRRRGIGGVAAAARQRSLHECLQAHCAYDSEHGTLFLPFVASSDAREMTVRSFHWPSCRRWSGTWSRAGRHRRKGSRGMNACGIESTGACAGALGAGAVRRHSTVRHRMLSAVLGAAGQQSTTGALRGGPPEGACAMPPIAAEAHRHSTGVAYP